MDKEIFKELSDFWHQLYQNPKKLQLDNLTGPWVRFESKLPWLKIKLPEAIDWARVLEEAKALNSMFKPHRAGGQHRGWESLVLYGLGTHKTQHYEHYGYKEEPFEHYHWTEISSKAAYTTEVFQKLFPYKNYSRIRFMKLKAGGFIRPHLDSSISKLGPINIALNQPLGCEMLMNGYGPIPYESGTVFNLDISRLHSVWNRSPEDRFHIIVHGEPGDGWNDILVKSYEDFLAKDEQSRCIYKKFDVKTFNFDHPIQEKEIIELANTGYPKEREIIELWKTQGVQLESLRESLQILVVEAHDFSNVFDTYLKPSLENIEYEVVSENDLQKNINQSEKDIFLILHPGLYIKEFADFLYEVLLQVNQMKIKGSHLSGHIIDKGGGRAPFIHEQMAILIKEDKNHRLSLENDNIAFPNYKPSDETFHGTYTPFFLAPTSNKEETQLEKPGWLSSVICFFLKQDEPVLNFPQSLRNTKIYSYPYDEDPYNRYRIRSHKALKGDSNGVYDYRVGSEAPNVGSEFSFISDTKKLDAESVSLFPKNKHHKYFWNDFINCNNWDQFNDVIETYFSKDDFYQYQLKRELNTLVHEQFNGNYDNFVKYLKQIKPSIHN